ncbi:pentapeptide repeat-containing protein [Actinosynnema sp. NPDC091369]
MTDDHAAPDPLPRPTPERTRPGTPPMRPLRGRVVAAVGAGIAVLTAGVVVALWWAGTAGISGAPLVSARFDAVRTGLGIGLGGGGLFALYLAWRRQHAAEVGLVQKERDQDDVARAYELQREVAEHTRLHSERVAAATERDAEARRVTDLYTKASDQLGSDKAPVRLAGLYALERLAQDNEHQRQTVVSVLCAYLRMPFDPPGDRPGEDVDQQTRGRAQEREVRLTAQRVLATHLRPGDAFWADTDVDLTGAVLIDLDFSRCVLRRGRFDEARFVGYANFFGSEFEDGASFVRATFAGRAVFYQARFPRGVHFDQGGFDGDADFTRAWFAKDAGFSATTFQEVARFTGAGFTALAWFRDTRFAAPVTFSDTMFSAGADFTRAAFDRGVQFLGTGFSGSAVFAGAGFGDGAEFFRARFSSEVDFSGATFAESADFEETVVAHPVTARSSWPPGWTPSEHHLGLDQPLEHTWPYFPVATARTWHELVPVT